MPEKQRPTPLQPGGVWWNRIGEWRNMLFSSSTLILQTAHPMVGAAVAEHSTYRSDPWGRLQRTLDSLQTYVYGGQAALDESTRLRKLHATIRGTDSQGRSYHALNADAWAWVHATFFDGILRLMPMIGEPLTPTEEQRALEEYHQLGSVLGVRSEKMPQTLHDFSEYMEYMLNDELEVNPVVEDILHTATLRTPRPPWLALPAPVWSGVRGTSARVHRWFTVGGLPPQMRAKLDLQWSAKSQKRLQRIGKVINTVTRYSPTRLRYMPIAAAAVRAERVITPAQSRLHVSG